MGPLLCVLILIGVIVFFAIKLKKDKEARLAEEERRRKQEEAEQQYRALERSALQRLVFSNWDIFPIYDDKVIVKSRAALDSYDHIKYLKENKAYLAKVEQVLRRKNEVAKSLNDFLQNNDCKFNPHYHRLEQQILNLLRKTDAYRVKVSYITSAGNNLGNKEVSLTQATVDRLKSDPSALMTKSEYTQFLKEQQKETLEQKRHVYYESINKVIDYANKHKEHLLIHGHANRFDQLVEKLYDRTVNSIQKIKTIDSGEWDMIKNFTLPIVDEMKAMVAQNNQIISYYRSDEFAKIKQTCSAMMSTQKEFNEYIHEKVQSISKLFGTRVVRSETINEDEYAYIRPYKKTITPFTAEVSANVFESAENNPLEYVVKQFYPNKQQYHEQIQKLHLLIEELETLKEAKAIIDNYKKDYQKYLGEVPAYVWQYDEAGFYSRLGFAHIDESVLTVEYKFSYTSGGGLAHRSFTVPMTEETIVELIHILESKLTEKAFAKEQRALMTKKLREHIKVRDNFTCCICGNSTHKEPNLLLEIDHVIPVAKGGCTIESNLQTLCWKCNRSKGAKL